MSAPRRLTDALAPFAGLPNRPKLVALAELADVPVRIARMASQGRGVSVDHHLRLAAAVGFDPYLGGRTFAPFKLGRFQARRFGGVVRVHRKLVRLQNIQAGAKEAGVSVRAMSFIENGRTVSVEAILNVCGYVGLHPFLFARNCFTENESRNPSVPSQETRSAA